MRFSFLLKLTQKLVFFFGIVVLALQVVIVMCLPERLGCFCPLNVFVCLLLQIVKLQVAVGHDIVLTKTISLYSFAFLFLSFILFWPFFWRLEVMIFVFHVAQDVIVLLRVLTRTEVPRFLLWIVWPLLKALHFALKVQYVVSLFVSQCSVLILCQNVNEVLLFEIGYFSLVNGVGILLDNWIVYSVLILDKFMGDFFVGHWFKL